MISLLLIVVFKPTTTEWWRTTNITLALNWFRYFIAKNLFLKIIYTRLSNVMQCKCSMVVSRGYWNRCPFNTYFDLSNTSWLGISYFEIPEYPFSIKNHLLHSRFMVHVNVSSRDLLMHSLENPVCHVTEIIIMAIRYWLE